MVHLMKIPHSCICSWQIPGPPRPLVDKRRKNTKNPGPLQDSDKYATALPSQQILNWEKSPPLRLKGGG